MGEIIGIKEFKHKNLENQILSYIRHEDKAVENAWRELALEAFRKWPGPPGMDEGLSLSFPECVSQEEANQIGGECAKYINKYQEIVSGTMFKMLAELIQLQKHRAEKIVKNA